jgi:hypothetical protein
MMTVGVPGKVRGIRSCADLISALCVPLSVGAAGAGVAPSGEVHAGVCALLMALAHRGQNLAMAGAWRPQLRHVTVPWLGFSFIIRSLHGGAPVT